MFIRRYPKRIFRHLERISRYLERIKRHPEESQDLITTHQFYEFY